MTRDSEVLMRFMGSGSELDLAAFSSVAVSRETSSSDCFGVTSSFPVIKITMNHVSFVLLIKVLGVR